MGHVEWAKNIQRGGLVEERSMDIEMQDRIK